MKKTTPSYGEEKTGKATFEVKVPLVPVAPIERGCNLMVKDILKRAKNNVLAYHYGEINSRTFCNKMMELLEKLKTQPKNSYYDSFLADPESKKFPEYFKHVVIKNKDVVDYIISNLPPLYQKAYSKGIIFAFHNDPEYYTHRLRFEDLYDDNY